MSQPSVSVAMATYNGAKYIAEQVYSICSQSVAPAEIIISDDGSQDETVSIAVGIAKSFATPLRVVRHAKNVGVIKNFMSAFRLCTGDFIAYCDQDDVWDYKKLSAFVELKSTQNVALFIHSSEVVDENLIGDGFVLPSFGQSGAMKFPSYIHGYYGFGHQMIFDRRLMPLLEYLHVAEHGRLSVCFDWMIPFAASGIGAVWVDTSPLVKFRRHDYSTSSAGKEEAGRLGICDKVKKKRSELHELRREIKGVLADSKLRAVMSVVDAASTDEFYSYLLRFDRLLDYRLAIYGGGGMREDGFLKTLLHGGYRDRRISGNFGREACLHDLVGVAFSRFC